MQPPSYTCVIVKAELTSRLQQLKARSAAAFSFSCLHHTSAGQEMRQQAGQRATGEVSNPGQKGGSSGRRRCL